MENEAVNSLDLEALSVPDPTKPPLMLMGGLVDALAADAEARFDARDKGQPFGPVVSLGKVAAEYGGALPAGLHCVMGGSGVGKTAFALQIAATCGCPSLYVSMEMSPLELLRRHMARVTGEYLGRFRTGELAPSTVRSMAMRAAAAAPNLAIMDGTQIWPEAAHIEHVARLVKRDSPHLLVVIDSLHSWADAADSEGSEYEAVSDAVAVFRSLSQRIGCAVIAITERNRASFGKGAGKDKIAAGASSRKIEYGSESVLSLERAEGVLPDDPEHETVIDLTFAKNRNGSAGKEVRLVFHGARQSYREWLK